MDLGYGPGYEAFRAEVWGFLAEHWPGGDVSAEKQSEFRKSATAAGYLYRDIPRRFGGSEQPVDLLKSEIIRAEFKKLGAPMELKSRGLGLLVPTLLAWGSEAQKAHFIPGTINGAITWAQGYSEPGAGSDLASLRTRAELVGDEWIINGQKIWTSDAHKASHMFMLVRTEPDRPKHEGISYLIVKLSQPGVTIRPLRQITGDAEFNEVFFDNASAPRHWLVGERGKGWLVSRTTLKHERTNLTGIEFHTGMFQRLVELARSTLRDGKPIIEDPIIRDRLAALHGWLLTTTYSTYRQLSMAAADKDGGAFPAMMKLNGSNMARELYELGRDIIGDDFLLAAPGRNGIGARENRAWARQAMTSLRLAIAGGSSNIQRNIIAERVLGLPRDAQTDAPRAR